MEEEWSLFRGMGGGVGASIRHLRERRGISQEGLCEQINKGGRRMSPPYLSRIELGKEIPSAELLVEIAKALDYDADRILILAGKVAPDLIDRLSHDYTFVKAVRELAKEM